MREFQNVVEFCVYVHIAFSGEGVYSFHQNLFIYRATKNFDDCFRCVKGEWINFPSLHFSFTISFYSFVIEKIKDFFFFHVLLIWLIEGNKKRAARSPGFGTVEVGYRRGHSLYPTGVRQILEAFVTCPCSDLPVRLHVNLLLPAWAGVTWPSCPQDHFIRTLGYAGSWHFGNTNQCFLIPLLEPQSSPSCSELEVLLIAHSWS